MNAVTIQRIFNQSESSGKHRYGGKKPINGDKRRRCEEYDLKKSNQVRRKQTKVNYDTWRRPEMPCEEDERLENIHYSNFLGDKYGDNNAPYNSEYPVSLRYCDSMREEEQQDDVFDNDSHARKIKRMNVIHYSDSDSEEDAASLDTLTRKTIKMNIVSPYCSEDEEEEEELYQAKMRRFYAQEYEREVANFDEMMEYFLDMYCAISKRAREQYCDAEEPQAKRARCDDESNKV
jgi:hypothetical protein